MFDDPTSRNFARSAGLAYLVIALASAFALLWVPSQLTVPNDPLATLNLIAQHPGLFTAGLTAEFLVVLVEIALSVLLYVMFRQFGETLALMAMIARLMVAAVMAAMLMPQAGVYALAVPTPVFSGLDPMLRAEHAWALHYIRDAGLWVWQVLFALHLWLLSTLALRNTDIPRLIIYGVLIGSTGYLLDGLRAYAMPASGLLTLITGALFSLVALSELIFALWLLRRGKITL